MVDFSNVARQKVSSDDTATYDLFDIDMEGAQLIVAPATRSNRLYNKAVLELTVPQQRRLQGGKVNANFLEKHLEDMIPLYARHVIKGWNNIVDKDGNSVPFSEDNAKSFLQALPFQSFDSLVEFCSNEANFRDNDATELAKNSQPS